MPPSISYLAFASAGGLHGHVSADHDPFALIEVGLAATELLGAEVNLFWDEVLRNEDVSADLVTVSAL